MTLETVKNYLRIDFIDDDVLLNTLIEVSAIYINSCVGEAYKKDIKLVKLAELLQLKIITDLYENRSTEIASNTKKDMTVTTILDKLSNTSSSEVI